MGAKSKGALADAALQLWDDAEALLNEWVEGTLTPRGTRFGSIRAPAPLPLRAYSEPWTSRLLGAAQGAPAPRKGSAPA
jgi:hypothetical protein